MFNPDKYLSVVWQKGGRVYPELDCFGKRLRAIGCRAGLF